ncbi:MAG: hypothetical protein CSA97_04435 [Bacteroidetes bacterium]|nr:MAG: hypothetical protein CSA97_04435 [Bacteroidota bacterium]
MKKRNLYAMLAMALMVLVGGAFVSCEDDDDKDDDKKFEVVGKWKAEKYKPQGKSEEVIPDMMKGYVGMMGFELKADNSVVLEGAMAKKAANHKFIWKQDGEMIIITAEVKGADATAGHDSGMPKEFKLKIDGERLVQNMNTANVKKMAKKMIEGKEELKEEEKQKALAMVDRMEMLLGTSFDVIFIKKK